jgi:hypothetical protein
VTQPHPQEDPGNQAVLARIWKFYPRVEIAKHDPNRFGDRKGATTLPPTPPFNSDEESSGVIEITRLLRRNLQGPEADHSDSRGDDELDEGLKWVKRGYRYYLAISQAHYPATGDPKLVERGHNSFPIAAPRNSR